MMFLPQSQATPRAARAHLGEPTPAVLRFKDGRRLPATLKTISVTGGLLVVPHPVDTGSKGKLMFLTGGGLVLASAEMLSPLSWGLQAFRFVELGREEQELVRGVVEAHSAQNCGDKGQIERSRAW